jgi:hypothetical protein
VEHPAMASANKHNMYFIKKYSKWF